MQTALASFDPDWAIEQIANGAFLRDLSAQTGIDKRRLSEQLRKHPHYPAAKESAIEVQLDDAQVAIIDAADAVDIARARERFKAASWRAEREVSHRWGNKTQVELSGTITVDHAITSDMTAILARALAVQQAKEIDITPTDETE